MRKRFQLDLQQAALASLAAISVATALLWFFWTVIVWSRWHPELPWRDLFVILDDLKPLLSGELAWKDAQFLFEAHYAAHRITLPRLLVYWDMNLFSGQSHLLYAAGWCSLLFIYLLYSRLVCSYFGQSKALAWFCIGLVGILLFSPAHSWNLINAINTSWHISYALGALAFYLLSRQSGNPGNSVWLLAYSLATVAAFTNFAGVIVWLLLPTLALRSGRRVLILAICTSALMTLSYLNGISSDAEIAASWSAGNPDVAAKIQQAGKIAIENNSLLRVFIGTSRVLCWPLSEARSTLGILFFTTSLLIIAFAWIQFFRAALAGLRLQPWIEWCLMLATMSLGIGISIQLGRMIEQPNHAHGPSFERYNTIVAMYWMGTFSILLSTLPRMPMAAKFATMLLSIMTIYLLLSPEGRYLKQEIKSVEKATKLFVAGESPELKEKIDKRMLRFKPEYVYTFEPLFEAKSLAYRAPLQLKDDPKSVQNCDASSFNALSTVGERDDRKQIQFIFKYPSSMLIRDIIISRDGAFLGRMHPDHLGNYSPRQLVDPAFNRWIGYLNRDSSLDDRMRLTFNLIAGVKHECILPADSLTASL
ncbi:MAG: hypothetical protein ABJK25_08790 [Halieaceae bacterium]